MTTTSMSISLPIELRARMKALDMEGNGGNWSAAAVKGLERAVAWIEHTHEGKPLKKPDPVLIMATLIQVLTDAELSETLKLIADRLTIPALSERRASVLNNFAMGEFVRPWPPAS